MSFKGFGKPPKKPSATDWSLRKGEGVTGLEVEIHQEPVFTGRLWLHTTKDRRIQIFNTDNEETLRAALLRLKSRIPALGTVEPTLEHEFDFVRRLRNAGIEITSVEY